MEMIKAWVRDLAILVIFASMLEMLLPNGSLKKYVKLVMGFFVMLTILNPVLSFFRADYTAFYPFNYLPNGKSQQAAILQQGQQMKEANDSLAVGAFRAQLEQQIRALILTQGEVEDAQVQVQAGANGEIEAVKIGLHLTGPDGQEEKSTASSAKVESIQPVKIQVRRKQENREQSTEQNASSNPNVPAAAAGHPAYSRSASAGSIPGSISQSGNRSSDSEQIQKIQQKVAKLIASFYNLKPDAISFQ